MPKSINFFNVKSEDDLLTTLVRKLKYTRPFIRLITFINLDSRA